MASSLPKILMSSSLPNKSKLDMSSSLSSPKRANTAAVRADGGVEFFVAVESARVSCFAFVGIGIFGVGALTSPIERILSIIKSRERSSSTLNLHRIFGKNSAGNFLTWANITSTAEGFGFLTSREIKILEIFSETSHPNNNQASETTRPNTIKQAIRPIQTQSGKRDEPPKQQSGKRDELPKHNQASETSHPNTIRQARRTTQTQSSEHYVLMILSQL